MILGPSRKSHRSLTLLVGLVFASSSIPISIIAQPNAMVLAQTSAPETSPDMGDRQRAQAFGGQLAVFLGHSNYVHRVEFSPDGNHVLTVSWANTVRLWDRGGYLLAVFQHEASVTNAVFSPDGQYILTASWDQTARLWDRGGTLLAVLNHENPVRDAIFSPDGQNILTTIYNGTTAHLWNMDGRVAIFQDVGSVESATFSPDSQYILMASGKITRLWNRQGSQLAILNHEDEVNSAVFSPTGQHILTASDDKTARLWDHQGNQFAIFNHDAEVRSAAFSPDGQSILTVSNFQTVGIWDKQGNQLIVFQEHGYIAMAVFSPDGHHILTTGRDKTARLWDKQGKQLAVFQGHEGGVTSAVFSSDGKYLLTGSGDKTARLWNVFATMTAHSRQWSILQSFNRESARNNGQLAIFRHAYINNAVFSPDGQHILIASEDKTARLWDREGNQLTVFRGHINRVNSAFFSPDGQYILTTSDDKTIRLWDLQGTQLTVSQEYEWSVSSAILSPDSRHMLTISIPASGDKTARLWDRASNQVTVFNGHTDRLRSAVFSPNGQHILTTSDDKTARLWDKDGSQITVFSGHESFVYSADFSPDGQRILTASGDKTARLWDRDGNQLAILRGHQDRVNSVVFSPDGQRILTASDDKTARLWDRGGNQLAIFSGHESFVFNAVFSPNSHHILTTGSDGTIRLWDILAAIEVQTPQGSALQTFEEEISDTHLTKVQHGGYVYSAVFSPDSHYLLTASADNTARLWDRQGKQLVVLSHENEAYSAVFSPDSQYLLTASADNTARLWDRQGNQLVVLSHENEVYSAVFSPDSQHYLTASRDRTVRLWNLQGDQLVVLNHENEVYSAVFSPDGQHILTASGTPFTANDGNGKAHLWDLQGNQLAVLQGHEAVVTSAVFSLDGRYILTASWDNTARLWDQQGNQLAIVKHESEVYSAVFSPDSQYLLTAGNDQTARLWDLQGNQLAIFQGHEDRFDSAIFSPDGRHILTASDDNSARLRDLIAPRTLFLPDNRFNLNLDWDKTIRLWDRDGNQLAIFRGHNSKVSSVVFSPDGQHLFTASEDNTARLWDISTGRKVSTAETALQQGIQVKKQGSKELREAVILKLQEAHRIYLEFGNSANAAKALLLIGSIQADLGEFHKALDSYNQGLALSQQTGAKAQEAASFNSLGALYQSLAMPKTALEQYEKALPLLYQLKDKQGAATTLNKIGDIQDATGTSQDALNSYTQALTIARTGLALAQEADALAGISKLHMDSQNWDIALTGYNQAFVISQHLNDKIKEANIIKQAGRIEVGRGQQDSAQEYYTYALALAQELGYQTEEADILYYQAILNRQQNNLAGAKTAIEAAINIVETLRSNIGAQDFRTSYFATVQAYYQFYIDLLMQLHQQNPERGYDRAALHISERARARSLLELLTEANANIRQGADPQLLDQEKDLQDQLNTLERQRYELVANEYNNADLEALKTQSNDLLDQLDQLEAQIRITSPGYASLKYPEPLTPDQIQQQVLDEDTLLLQYSLGEDRSYLWAVTKDRLSSYELPPAAEIEAAAQPFRNAITQNSEAGIDTGIPLSQILLTPVASQLENKRLLIVGDGVLQYIPFAALPLPEDSTTPLLVQNEIVTLPSASTVTIQRQQLANRVPAPKTLAVLADPVFEVDDERVTGTPPPPNPDTIEKLALRSAARDLGIGDSGPLLNRLEYTRPEGEAILSFVPQAQHLAAFNFQASREVAIHPHLAQYQIIHMATHGILNPVNPELSGMVLSLFDKDGEEQNGFLRLHDIFNLNLPAELVVLSACETGLGEDVKGEGLVGLTRGFMYAGAKQVVVSLWRVDDQGTSEIMETFYRNMLQDEQPPITALRDAQLEMWNSGRSPYYWAAFTIQGDWK